MRSAWPEARSTGKRLHLPLLTLCRRGPEEARMAQSVLPAPSSLVVATVCEGWVHGPQGTETQPGSTLLIFLSKKPGEMGSGVAGSGDLAVIFRTWSHRLHSSVGTAFCCMGAGVRCKRQIHNPLPLGPQLWLSGMSPHKVKTNREAGKG